jgi:hypothetical protein
MRPEFHHLYITVPVRHSREKRGKNLPRHYPTFGDAMSPDTRRALDSVNLESTRCRRAKSPIGLEGADEESKKDKDKLREVKVSPNRRGGRPKLNRPINGFPA